MTDPTKDAVRAERETQEHLLSDLRGAGKGGEADKLARGYHAQRMAGLAEDVYESARGEGKPPAGWTRASGWDIKELMEYVGWKDVKSAMRYLDASDSSLQARFEQGLTALAPAVPQLLPLLLTEQIEAPRPPAEGTTPMAVLRVTLVLARFSKQSRGLARGHRLIEQTCFERFAMQRLNTEGTLYELAVPYLSRDLLDEVIATLLDDMYRIAEDNQCLLETSFHEPATDSHWD